VASTTVFGSLSQLETIRTTVTKAKSSAEAALGEAQGIRSEVGAKGKNAKIYDKLMNLAEALNGLKTATCVIAESQGEAGSVVTEVLDTLTNFINEAAQALGMGGSGIDVEKLSDEEVFDPKKMNSKLDEIRAKLEGLKESIEKQEVSIKSWFESAE